MDVSIIIVNYNTRDLLQRCLRSVYAETKEISFEVFVVDNNSQDGSGEMLGVDFPHVTTILNIENKGFSAANNQALTEAKGQFVLLLNSDTKILDGTIQKMYRFMKDNPGIGISGCKLLNEDGTLQQSCGNFPSMRNLFAESLFLNHFFPKLSATEGYFLRLNSLSKEMDVDVIKGAFMMIRSTVMKSIGFLDESFFMYTEETDFCYRAKKAGFRVVYSPNAEVVHYEGGSVKDIFRHYEHIHTTQLYFLQKHYHGFRYFSVVFFRLLGVIIRIPSYALLGILTMEKRWLVKSQIFLRVCLRLLASVFKIKNKGRFEKT